MIREAEDASFDWFKSYADVASDIRKLIPSRAARILMLGCGNSKFSEDVSDSKILFLATNCDQMWEDGYKNIVNVDVCFLLQLSKLIYLILLPKYSPVVIEKMRNRHKDVRPEMTCSDFAENTGPRC
jgi:hypothetical protein